MLSRRCYLFGLLSALLALMAQLSAGATVPCLDPVVQLVGAEALCHETHDSGGAPAKAPVHPLNCLACSLCCAAQPPISLLPAPPHLTPPRVVLAERAELPPPSRAPPFRLWSPAQPRAPPSVS
jgi:hypothetical protein